MSEIPNSENAQSLNFKDAVAKSMENGLNPNEIEQLSISYNKEKSEIIKISKLILRNNLEKTYLEQGFSQKGEDIKSFLDDVFSDSMKDGLSIFNESEFARLDNNEGFSEYELQQFKAKLDTAIKRMGLLGSYNEFKKSHENATDYSVGWENADKFLAKRLDGNNIYIPFKGNVNIAEALFDEIGDKLGDVSGISEEELHKMREESFDITSYEKMKDFVILLGVEIGEGIEDIVKLLLNLGAGVTLAPRYISNKMKIEGAIDTAEEAKLKIENERMLEENPSLALIELATNGGEILSQLWEKMKTGNNGVVAMGVVSIVGLLAGGAGAAKLIGKGAKIAGKGSKIAKMGAKIEDLAGNIGKKLNSLDNTISTGGLNKLLGKITKAEKLPNGIQKLPNGLEANQKVIYKFDSGWEVKLANSEGKIMITQPEIVNGKLTGNTKIKWVEQTDLKSYPKNSKNIKNSKIFEKINKELSFGDEVSFVIDGKKHTGTYAGDNINSGGTIKINSYGKRFDISGKDLKSIKKIENTKMRAAKLDIMPRKKELSSQKFENAKVGDLLEIKTSNGIQQIEKISDTNIFKIVGGENKGKLIKVNNLDIKNGNNHGGFEIKKVFDYNSNSGKEIQKLNQKGHVDDFKGFGDIIEINNISNNLLGDISDLLKTLPSILKNDFSKNILKPLGKIEELNSTQIGNFIQHIEEFSSKLGNKFSGLKQKLSDLISNINIFKKLNYKSLEKIKKGEILELKTKNNSLYIFEKQANGKFKLIGGTNEKLIQKEINNIDELIILNDGSIAFGDIKTSPIKKMEKIKLDKKVENKSQGDIDMLMGEKVIGKGIYENYEGKIKKVEILKDGGQYYLVKEGDGITSIQKNKFKEITIDNATIITKREGEGTVVLRFGERYGNLSEEYNTLKKMYKIDAEHTVRPISLKNGEMKIEEIKNVIEYKHPNEIPLEIREKVLSTIKKFHKEGVYHGDLNGNNILFYKKENGQISFKIIDPAGFPDNFQYVKEAEKLDLETLKENLNLN